MATKAAAKKPATKPAKKRSPGNGNASKLLDALGIDAICAQIRDGLSMTSIAHAAGVSFGTLSNWLAKSVERSAHARDARAAAAQLWDEMALDGIQAAADNFQLTKARDAAHHLRWRASKVAPRDYGDKVDVNQNTTLVGTLDLTLDGVDAYKLLLDQ